MNRVQRLLVLLVLVAACDCRSRASEGVAGSSQAPPRDAQVAQSATEVAVTVDDLPVHGPAKEGTDRMAIAERFLAVFERHGLRSVYGFVNGKKVAEDESTESILRRWKDAGHLLGNHTYSHASLNAVTLSEYLTDLEKGEVILKKLEPVAVAWKVFRYPFLFEGDTREKRDGVRRYLHEHGYVVAPVTIDADDWAFNAPFARCAARNDTQSLAKLRRTLVDVHVDELRRMRELTMTLVQHDARQVLLLHIGAAEADGLEDLLTAYEKQGVRWIDLRTALLDPLYSLDAGDIARYGAALPYRLAKARGIHAPEPIFAREIEDDLARVCPGD